MALKSTYSAEEKGAEIEEALDTLDKVVDRLKVLYEQYFMGIQKQAPSHLHNETERRIRDVAQLNIRNTALRYRFATIQQKYGAYNTYWKRSVREIESGRYVRSLSKLRRQAMAHGEDIPPEILAAMPKRMRDAVERDRAAALAEAARRGQLVAEQPPPPDDAAALDADTEPAVARIVAPPPPHRRRPSRFTTDPFEHAGEADIADALASLADEALAALDKPAAPEDAAAARPGAKPPPIPPPRRTSATRPPPVAPQPVTARRSRTPTSNPRPAAATRPPPVRGHSGTRPPPNATTPAARPAAHPPIPGMSEAQTRALYAKYLKAREMVGDKTEGFTYDKLMRTLSNQAPKILADHKANAVEFNVVIRDNKVILKAKPR